MVDFKKRTEERKDHKSVLAKKYGVEGNKKLDQCYALAWEYGHAYGHYEVEIHFSRLVELIK